MLLSRDQHPLWRDFPSNHSLHAFLLLHLPLNFNVFRTDSPIGTASILLSNLLYEIRLCIAWAIKRCSRGFGTLLCDGHASSGSEEDDNDEVHPDMLSISCAWLCGSLAAVFPSLLTLRLLHVSLQNLSGTPRATLCAGPT